MSQLLSSLWRIIFCAHAFSASKKINNDAPGYFLSLADIHFDPFYSCHAIPCPLILQLQKAPASHWDALFAKFDTEPPRYKSDSNYQLLKSALNASKEAGEKYHVQFVIILGDFLGHSFRSLYGKYSQDKSRAGFQTFTKKTLEFLTNELARTFPSLDVYTVVGNNDSFHYNYYADPNGQFFKEVGRIWSRLLINKKNSEQMQEQFSHNGYYALDFPTPQE